jgi:sugar phosphate isomerase/epimerase
MHRGHDLELALVMVCYFDRPWEDALHAVARHGLTMVEPCGGGHIPKTHYDPVALAEDSELLASFRESLESRNLQIAALGVHGNPVHPDRAIATAHHDDFVATCKIASELEVGVVDVISGTPAGGPQDKTVNWIVNFIWPHFTEAYRWQWEERLIPYWKEAAEIAASYGVRIAIEPHGGSTVYNLQTFIRLRDAVGETIGANVDPSHLFWLGIDVMDFVADLGETIILAHAKDVAMNERLVRRDGLIPAVQFDDWDNRSWSYRALGHGHDSVFWRNYVTALRRAGYDGPVVIEIEEPYYATDDAVAQSVAVMREALPTEGIPRANWFDKYQWKH